MLIFGGFDGRLKSDLLVYVVGMCTSLSNKEQCLTTMPGVKCVWNKAAKKCEPLTNLSKEGYEKCPGNSRPLYLIKQMTSLSFLNHPLKQSHQWISLHLLGH